jgi:hypothetical protein
MNYVNTLDELIDNETFINEQSFDEVYDNSNIMDVEEFEILDEMGMFEE